MNLNRTLWFVRHAQSEYNEKKLFTGWHDPPLTNHGVAMAEELKKEIDTVNFSHVFSSPLKRAFQTAKIIVPNDEITIDDRIKERSYGDWSAKNKDQVKDIEGEEGYVAARRGWHTSPPNGESLKDVSERVQPFLDALPGTGNILIVSHGNTIRALSVIFGINTTDSVSSYEIKVGAILKI